MPTLDWIGRRAVINHHREVPYRLIHDNAELSVGDPDAGNLLVQGDNLLALKALLPYYAGKVKFIYIDPPYNTGMDARDVSGKRTGWTYSDNLNSPEIRSWLGKVVGEEAEDLSRHDKWLCMMYPRLALLKDFLTDDGLIFASIDENEYANLRTLLDELFGSSNRVGTIVWKNVTDNNPTQIAIEHEYILCYARKKERLPKEWKSTSLALKEQLLEVEKRFLEEFAGKSQLQSEYTKWFRKNKDQLGQFHDYKFIDVGGIYTGMRSVHNPGKEGYRYNVLHPTTGRACTQPMMGYRFPESTMKSLIQEGRIIFGEDESKLIELKVYAKDYRAKLSSLIELDGRVGTNELKAIFPDDKRPFDFPKPTGLLRELISFTTKDGDIVLDSFAGSGTTGHAVLAQNRADGCNRRFVAVEMDDAICRNITRPRLERVVQGYGDTAALGSGFRFCTLGEPLFDELGNIRDGVTFVELAAHVFFTETGSPLPAAYRAQSPSPSLGVHEGKAVYLLFNGILGDKRPEGGNVLTSDVLKALPAFAGTKVIYGEGCRLSDAKLRREDVVFKQVPYQIQVN